jgi:peptidoglycan/LPS O-acetylase OafA/YrhL
MSDYSVMMRSTNGQHWIGLDHIRAVAAFLVFTWHFSHSTTGYPVSLSGAPSIFPLSILDEGHTGVALFMTLSGYIFAKILDGRSIIYPLFYWNRFIRLAPLLLVAILLAGIERFLHTGVWAITASFLAVLTAFATPMPMLGHGWWSTVVETQFYIILPFLMMVTRQSRWALLLIVVVIASTRLEWVTSVGNAKNIAYWTIFGHIDQFTLGICAFQNRDLFRRRHGVAIGIFLTFTLFYYLFDMAGGWYGLDDRKWHGYVWAILPTIEGLAYASLIAYYDGTFEPSNRGLSGFIAKAGSYSYSIYLMHFFFVFSLARFIDHNVMSLSNFYVASLWSLVCFLAMVPFAHLCFHWVEAPFLKMRRPYVRMGRHAQTPTSYREDLDAAAQGCGGSTKRLVENRMASAVRDLPTLV